jgi:hypothetical protein
MQGTQPTSRRGSLNGVSVPNGTWAALALGLVMAGCPTDSRTQVRSAGDLAGPSRSIATFSETTPFTSVTRLADDVYAGTSAGVIRFDARTREFVRLTAKQGLPADRVDALSGDPASGLWVATAKGIARFHAGVWTNHPTSQVTGGTVTALLATRWGVWAGGPHGLGRLEKGKWTGYLRGAKVTYLLGDLSGDGLWVGTDGEGIYHGRGESFVSHSPAKGQRIRHVHSMTYTKSGGLLAAGTGEGGQMLAFFDGRHWTCYRPRPAVKLSWVTQVAGEVLLAGADRVLVLRQTVPTATSTTPPAGPVELERVLAPDVPADYPAPLFYTAPFDRWLPPDPTVVVGHGRYTLIGTRAAGLVQFDGVETRWFRTRDLVGQAEKLMVACSGGSCLFAGGGTSYRFDGAGFKALTLDPEPTTVVQGFVVDRGGEVLAVAMKGDGRTLAVGKVAGDKLQVMREHKLTLPEGKAEVRFVRLGPAGELWIGLRVREEGEARPWGVVVSRPDGSMLYHRSTLLPGEDRAPGSLALPDDARDVYFSGEETWLATGMGACRVRGDKVTLFTENEGLESEIIHAFARTPKGELIAATHGGVGRFDGKQWLFDLGPELRTQAGALLVEDGTVWIGTARGVVRWAEGKMKVTGVREGLAGGDVRDLHRDPLGRLWVLTGGGLSVIGPSPPVEARGDAPKHK